MSTHGQGPWKGQADNLGDAFAAAWTTAKGNGAEKDKEYPVKISIAGNNPIHTYYVEIGG